MKEWGKPTDMKRQTIRRKLMSNEKHKLASLSSLGLSEKQKPVVETGSDELSLKKGVSGQEWSQLESQDLPTAFPLRE